MRYIPTLLAGAALAIAACNEKTTPKTKSSESAPAARTAAEAASSPSFAVPDTFKAALGKVFDGYAALQTALAQDDLAKAKEAFNGMHVVLHMMPKDSLNTAAKAYWDSADVRIMKALHPLASSDSLPEVRARFMDFTGVMLDVIETFGIAGDGSIHQFHCPMANDNKGADWLQKSRALENPYFGKSMLKCGSLVRTLKD
ncbi:MAG TPA: DUF3347 domain-containing protein [Fibrobacteria bacterium]|nr:DUF3347 domain-containing protein [Fibrobacteria bacterium]